MAKTKTATSKKTVKKINSKKAVKKAVKKVVAKKAPQKIANNKSKIVETFGPRLNKDGYEEVANKLRKS